MQNKEDLLKITDDFNGYSYLYEDIEIPNIGDTTAICLGIVEANKYYSKENYINPIVTNVANCTSCRNILFTNNPDLSHISKI